MKTCQKNSLFPKSKETLIFPIPAKFLFVSRYFLKLFFLPFKTFVRSTSNSPAKVSISPVSLPWWRREGKEGMSGSGAKTRKFRSTGESLSARPLPVGQLPLFRDVGLAEWSTIGWAGKMT